MPSPPIIEQLDTLLKEISEFTAGVKRGTIPNAEPKGIELSTRAHAAIERVAPTNSAYRRQADEIRRENQYERFKVADLAGVLQALSTDVKSGCMQSFEELVHGELFGDFLDMAQYLVESGYKDAAAVIAGSSLEAHLRQLAKRHDIVLKTDDGKHKTADTINADLNKADAYSKLDQKSIIAWLDLRNKAAHGRYSDYQKDQVTQLIASIRNFITRVPA